MVFSGNSYYNKAAVASLRQIGDNMSTEGIIGTILGLVGIITGYIFYRKGLRLREPTVSLKTNNLIQDHVSQLDGLEIRYKGHTVKNLSVTKVVFWNNGAETINNSDIVKANPLRIGGFNDVQLLDAQVITSNNDSSRIICEFNDDNELLVTFDYLDKGHGAVIQITHTGLSSNDLTVAGQIKGVSEIKWVDLDFDDIVSPRRQYFYKPSRVKKPIRRVLSLMFWLFGGGLFSCIGFSYILAIYENGWRIPESTRESFGSTPPPDFIFFALSFGFAFIGVYMLFLAADILRKRIPKGLEAFESD
jgi:hypothetical protein